VRAPRAEFLVGVFALMVIAILAFMTFRVGEITIKEKAGYTVYAFFKNTAGLVEKTRIKVAGVDAGTIENIELINGMAKVTIRVIPTVVLYSDATASIRSSGLLGDKFLDLEIGSKSPVLRNGDIIQNVVEVADVDNLVRSISDASKNLAELVASISDPETTEAVKESLMNLRDITDELERAVTENNTSIQGVIDRIDSLVASLDDIVKTNREPLSGALANLDEFSASLRADGSAAVENMKQVSEELKDLLKTARQDIETITQKASTAMDSTAEITEKLQKGEGTLGKLLTDEELYDSLKQTVSGVSNTVGAIERFRTYVTFQADYLTKPEKAKGYFYVTLQPRKDKYYILGIVSDPVGSVDLVETTDGVTTREDVSKEIEFTAQFAKRFHNTALRIGMTESTFGLGADQFLLNDRIKLALDAWDFGEDEFKADNPHLRFGADYFLFRNVYLTVGVDNILNDENMGLFVGTGLTFSDEDLKYLFGIAPKPGL
jgi:phospholipid/cholesterol/gamma-HCH transport system substrate-binding protein